MSTITTTDFSMMELESLAIAITAENGRAIRTAKTAIDHAIRCGEMLIAAKAKVVHGEWESWVTTETEISLRTASRYMQSAVKSATLADLEPDLIIAEALEMVTTPATAKREHVKAPNTPKPASAVTMDAEIVEPSPPAIDRKHEPVEVDEIKQEEPTVDRIPKWIPDDADRLWLLAKIDLDKILKEDKSRERVLNEVIAYCHEKLDRKRDALAAIIGTIPRLTKDEIKSLIETLNSKLT